MGVDRFKTTLKNKKEAKMINIIFLAIGFVFGYLIGYLLAISYGKRIILILYNNETDFKTLIKKLGNGDESNYN